jgi:hypothetical protein
MTLQTLALVSELTETRWSVMTRATVGAAEESSCANMVRLFIIGFELKVRSRRACRYSSLGLVHSGRRVIQPTSYYSGVYAMTGQ